MSRALSLLLEAIAVVIVLPIALFALADALTATPRIGAYRNLHPRLDVCREGLAENWTVLSQRDPSRQDTEDDDGWVDPSNNEQQAVAQDAAWTTRFQCALQKHVVPSKTGHAAALAYYLGFIEFDETGEPYALVKPGPDGATVPATPDLTNPPGQVQMLTQLDALRTHLNEGSNFVIVFIHGWRHNASIGDGNVADLRLYAAHAVRFLRRRCELGEKRFCDMRVTAIYIGWRGARVDEAYTKQILGDTVGGFLGTLAAGVTLFDRKPVSEQVAPGAITAIRAIERTLSKSQPNGQPKPELRDNRMIVFGHSLGGNMLATGLQDDLVKLVREHKGYDRATGRMADPVPPILGDLTILINPAAEASKWTAIQREVWARIPFHVDANKTIDDVEDGHKFFRDDQRPIIVSVTSALRFPPDGLRTADCEYLAQKPSSGIEAKVAHGGKPLDYDWATQDLFPTFKMDLRPLAARVQRFVAELEQRAPPGQTCDRHKPAFWRHLATAPIRKLAALLADFPFQNFNEESSHTIGHLDPPRPADGVLTDQGYSSGAPFGTTHELIGLGQDVRERHNPYDTLADAPLSCEPANRWLSRARAHAPPFGVFWDSSRLTPSADPLEHPPAANFLHGSRLSGTAAITRANDPFWNVRAYDNALARHDGYRLSSFICAMSQLVMDDITGAKIVLPNLAIDPTQQIPPPAPKP